MSDLRTFIGGGGGGSGATSFGTYATLPTTCAVGQQYITTNSIYTFVCTAADTWSSYLEGKPVTIPPTAGWTDENFEVTTSLTTAAGYHLMLETTVSNDIRARYRTAPATPFTCKAQFSYTGTGSNDNNWAMIDQRESSTGEWAIWVCKSNNGTNGNFTINTADNPSFVGVGTAGPFPLGVIGRIMQVATRDTGSLRQMGLIDFGGNFFVGSNGGASQTRTTTLTADQVGWGIYNNTAGSSFSAALVDWICQ